tara:strand:+ start:260 stop:505 length:246 start_codon:yes stop_codon:yes gene_type:complete
MNYEINEMDVDATSKSPILAKYETTQRLKEVMGGLIDEYLVEDGVTAGEFIKAMRESLQSASNYHKMRQNQIDDTLRLIDA